MTERMVKSMFLFALVFAIVAVCCGLSACNMQSTVVYDPNYDGATLITQSVSFGQKSQFPTPQRENYVFGGWYHEKECLNPAEETTMFFASVTYYAKWYPEITDLRVECLKEIYRGDTLSAQDFKVTAVFADETSKVVSDYNADFNFTENVGETNVVFSYSENGSEISVPVTFFVNEVRLTGISAVYNGRAIAVGAEIPSENIEVFATYNNGAQKQVYDFSTTFASVEGEQKVIVSYSESGVEKTCEFIVEVKPAAEVPVSISVSHDGTKFEVGEAFRPTTLTVTVLYADGHTEELNSKQYSYGGFSSKEVGFVTVNVSYLDFAASVAVEIINQPLVSISAKYNGSVIEVGGSLDYTQISVFALYETGYENQVFNFSVGNFFADNAGAQNVEITYTENGITVSTTVEITVVEKGAISSGSLSVHFLQLGNIYTGDSVYIKAGETDILIDAGSKNNSGATITNYLDKYVTDGKLEYVIATHAHEDHISAFYGSNGVFTKYKTDTIIEFALTNKTSTSTSTVYGKYVAARNNEVKEGATCYTAAQCFNETDGAQRIYQITEDISLEILYNYYYFNTQSSGENDYSVCVMLHQGENNYLFTGDLESGGEKKMVQYYENKNDPLPHCVLYKAGHHGSKTSSSAELMAAIKPEYVCVCCCCGTSEYTDTAANQFPTQEFINNVAPYTDKVYVTTMVDNYVAKELWKTNGSVKPMNGNIVFSCVNGKISVNCSENNTILKDTEWFKNNRTCPAAWK